jgi:DnaJ-class molecular chaperone
MTIDKKLTQDLFGYKSVPCLDCEGQLDLNTNTEDTCDECDGNGEIIINN